MLFPFSDKQQVSETLWVKKRKFVKVFRLVLPGGVNKIYSMWKWAKLCWLTCGKRWIFWMLLNLNCCDAGGDSREDTERSLNNSILNLQYLRDQIFQGSCLLERWDWWKRPSWWVSTPALSKLTSISKLQTNPFGKYIFYVCAKILFNLWTSKYSIWWNVFLQLV